jgi:uncharacterized membrane protein
VRRSVVCRRGGLGAAVALIVLLAGVAIPIPAAAQEGLAITTPFPAVTAQPGESVAFDLTISADEASRVDLSVAGVPDGWSVSLSGGGNEIQGVFVDSDSPASVTATVDVAEDAAPGSETLTVVAQSGSVTERLDLDLTIAESESGNVTLESDYPSLRGTADTSFQFNLTLENDTPNELTFALQATGPEGWEVAARPAGETNAASVTVAARETQRLEVTASAPESAPAGAYPISVDVAAGEQRATAELAIEITGTVEMTLTTPDERLDTTANAGSVSDFAVVVVNDGTSPLGNVDLAGTGPTDWDITFEPATIDRLEPGATASVTAHITPSANAVAGDYAINLTATTEGASEALDVRVAVETAPIWGIVGIGLIVAALGGMVWVFRRYGRR